MIKEGVINLSEPLGRIEYCTIGPVPVNGVVEIMSQLRDQEWNVKFVAFSGMIAVETLRVTSLQRPVPMPSYVIIAEKFFEKDVKFVPPVINMGGGNAINH